MANPSARFDIIGNSRTASAFAKTRSQMNGMRTSMGRMTRGVRDNRRVIQQAGMQMSDFAVQVGGGQDALLAFTQQVPQFVQGFGALGGVLAAFITIAGTLALIMVRTGKSLADITPIAGVLESELLAVVEAFRWMKETIIDAINVAVNNLDRLLGALTAITAFLVTKWVAGWFLATGAVNALIGAFVLLRRVLILSGIGALLVLIGAIGWQMVKLVEATGGWGAALNALGSLADKVWSGITDTAVAMGKRLRAQWLDIKAAFIGMIGEMAKAWATFVEKVADAVNLFDVFRGGEGLIMDPSGVREWADSFDTSVAKIRRTTSALREDADALTDGAWKPMRKELQTLLDMMNAVDKDGKRIDVRDWFGGGDDSGKGGGGGGGKKAKDALTELQERMKSLGDTIKTSVGGAMTDIVKRTKTVAEAFRDMATDIIAQLFDILVVQRLVGSFDASTGTGSGITGFLTKAMGGLLSFAGGGHTGNGSRSGGMDGKGGFLAMVHPKEKIIDETRGGSSSGVVISQAFDFSGAQAGVRQEVMSMMPQIITATKSAVLDARKRGGSFAEAFG